MKTIIQTTWENCYPSNWKGVIVPEAMAHPAKYSNRLIRRIYEHLIEMDWIHEGDRVIDPFGGVALGALDAMRLGLDWTGIELESKFHELGQAEYQCFGINPKAWKRYYHRPKMLAFFREHRLMCPSCASDWNNISDRKIPQREPHVFQGNIPLWLSKFGGLPKWGRARLLNGDSRKLLEIIQGQAQAAVSSPPYEQNGVADHKGQTDALKNGKFTGGGDSFLYNYEYGDTPGQLGNMRGDFAAALSSPPYAETDLSYKKNGLKVDGKEHYERPYMEGQTDHYGATPGQLGAMSAQGFDAAISSPPFLQSEGGTPEPKPGGAIDDRLYARHAAGNKSSHAYGESEGQLSDMKDGGFEAAISSPPYNPPMSQEHNGSRGGQRGTTPSEPGAFVKYGNAEGQLEGMGMDGFNAAISSPPYAAIAQTGGTEGLKKHGTGLTQGEACFAEYGENDGQLGRMSPDNFDAAVSSPPFESSLSRDGRDYADLKIAKDLEVNHGRTFRGSFIGTDYGDTPGNIGNDSGDDFWQAARTIVEQVYQALTPGGHACWVVKDYVKNKRIVPFSDQWRQLCEAVGFETLHEHHAMLVHRKGAQHTLEGGLIEHQTESKSFFRRLAEKNGSPRIDWETVFCMVKPEVEL